MFDICSYCFVIFRHFVESSSACGALGWPEPPFDLAFLTFLRFCQGIAIGGQWGGAMLLVTESAPSNRRGYYGAYAQAGAPVGVILANIAFISVSLLTTEESFLTWGWRIPFIISFVLVIISMYIQVIKKR